MASSKPPGKSMGAQPPHNEHMDSDIHWREGHGQPRKSVARPNPARPSDSYDGASQTGGNERKSAGSKTTTKTTGDLWAQGGRDQSWREELKGSSARYASDSNFESSEGDRNDYYRDEPSRQGDTGSDRHLGEPEYEDDVSWKPRADYNSHNDADRVHGNKRR